jgi:hypothetical protein
LPLVSSIADGSVDPPLSSPVCFCEILSSVSEVSDANDALVIVGLLSSAAVVVAVSGALGINSIVLD